MTTFAPEQDDQRPRRQIEQRTRRAWSAYQESLRELDGAEYEAAEPRAWERLQRRLAALDAPPEEHAGA